MGTTGLCLPIDKDGVVDKEIESYATLLEYGIFHKMMEVVPDKEESKIFNADKDKQAVCMLSFNEIKGLHIATVAWYKLMENCIDSRKMILAVMKNRMMIRLC